MSITKQTDHVWRYFIVSESYHPLAEGKRFDRVSLQYEDGRCARCLYPIKAMFLLLS